MKKAKEPLSISGFWALIILFAILSLGLGVGVNVGARVITKKSLDRCQANGCARLQEEKNTCDEALRVEIKKTESTATLLQDSQALVTEAEALKARADELYGNYDSTVSQYDLMDAITTFQTVTQPFIKSIKETKNVDFNTEGRN